MALTDSLISYWKMDEASGNAADTHSTNTLTDHNGVGTATGKLNGARDFELSSSQYMDHADNAALSTGDIDFTWTAWIQFETVSPTANMVFLSKGGLGSEEYALWYSVGADRIDFSIHNLGGIAVGNTLGTPSAATWYFLVGWHDSVANTVNIQINNGAVDSVSYSLGATDNASTLSFGADSDVAWFHDGLIDEVGFWKRVLTSDERTTLYGGGTPPAYETFSGAAAEIKVGSLLAMFQ